MIVIPGDPQPKGRPRARVAWRGSVPKHIRRLAYAQNYTPAETREYETIVCRSAQGFVENNPGALVAQLDFLLRRGVTVKRPLPIVLPDLDNLCKSVLDGLQMANAYKSDAQIVDLYARKRYATQGAPRVQVKLAPVSGFCGQCGRALVE